MEIVEQIQLKPSPQLSHLCHLTKNLYNEANYQYRQFYFLLEEFLTYYDLQVILKDYACYKALPAQTSQQILKLVIQNWKALQTYRTNSSIFLGAPRPPNYKPKDGESITIFTNQNVRVHGDWLYFPKITGLSPIKTRILQFQQIRIIPHQTYYMMEIVYDVPERDLRLNPNRIIGIDLGIENIVTIANNIGLPPIIVKGNALKSLNQFYNKLRAAYQSCSGLGDQFKETTRLARLTKKRMNQLNDVFHKLSRQIVQYCIQNNCGMIIIGYNPLWKQQSNLGRHNNQNFVAIPFAKLISKIQYKAQLVGITVILHDEAYTSKCSFLDKESIGFHSEYCGKRIKRGLFRSRAGVFLNADVNSAYNHIRNVVPTAFANGIAVVVLRPNCFSVFAIFLKKLNRI